MYLAYCILEPVPKVGEPSRDQEVALRWKTDKNWAIWVSGFSIYMAVIIQMQSSKAESLMKYMDIIHRA